MTRRGPVKSDPDRPAVLCTHCGGWPALHRDADVALCDTCWAETAR